MALSVKNMLGGGGKIDITNGRLAEYTTTGEYIEKNTFVDTVLPTTVHDIGGRSVSVTQCYGLNGTFENFAILNENRLLRIYTTSSIQSYIDLIDTSSTSFTVLSSLSLGSYFGTYIYHIEGNRFLVLLSGRGSYGLYGGIAIVENDTITIGEITKMFNTTYYNFQDWYVDEYAVNKYFVSVYNVSSNSTNYFNITIDDGVVSAITDIESYAYYVWTRRKYKNGGYVFARQFGSSSYYIYLKTICINNDDTFSVGSELQLPYYASAYGFALSDITEETLLVFYSGSDSRTYFTTVHVSNSGELTLDSVSVQAGDNTTLSTEGLTRPCFFECKSNRFLLIANTSTRIFYYGTLDGETIKFVTQGTLTGMETYNFDFYWDGGEVVYMTSHSSSSASNGTRYMTLIEFADPLKHTVTPCPTTVRGGFWKLYVIGTKILPIEWNYRTSLKQYLVGTVDEKRICIANPNVRGLLITNADETTKGKVIECI